MGRAVRGPSGRERGMNGRAALGESAPWSGAGTDPGFDDAGRPSARTVTVTSARAVSASTRFQVPCFEFLICTNVRLRSSGGVVDSTANRRSCLARAACVPLLS